MDKTFKNDEQLRRKALREGQKTKQERNRSFYLNGIQAVAILGLGIAVAALAEISHRHSCGCDHRCGW